MNHRNENEQRDSRQHYVDLYLKEVIKPLLPKATIGSIYSFGTPNGLYKSAKVGIGNGSRSFYGSKYYYRGKNEFIHYTSYPNLFNILNDKAIRMYDFNYLNDPQEFAFAAKTLNVPFIYPDSSDIKSQLFSLSMCEYNDNTKPDTFDMWRLYGLQGRGIGLVLEFENKNRINWLNLYMSKIHYGEKHIKCFEDFQKRNHDFHQKYEFKVNDSHRTILQLLAFHKQSIYSSENEVRLLKFIEKVPSWEEHDKHDVFICSNYRNRQSHYTHLELDSPERRKTFEKFTDEKMRMMAFKLFPVVKIKKVILGYEFSKTDLWDICKIVNKITKRNFDYQVPVEISHLAEIIKGN